MKLKELYEQYKQAELNLPSDFIPISKYFYRGASMLFSKNMFKLYKHIKQKYHIVEYSHFQKIIMNFSEAYQKIYKDDILVILTDADIDPFIKYFDTLIEDGVEQGVLTYSYFYTALINEI